MSHWRLEAGAAAGGDAKPYVATRNLCITTSPKRADKIATVQTPKKHALTPMPDTMQIVVPADAPRQIAESPQLERLRRYGEVKVFRDLPASLDALAERMRAADIVINSRSHVRWPAELFERTPRLKMLTTCSIGVDAIDLAAARKSGVVVSNIPGQTATVVAEHAVAMLLAAAKRLAFQTAELKAGRWTLKHNISLAGKTLGVIGAGPIGAEMVRLGRAVGMRVVAWTFHPSPERAAALGAPFVEFDELLQMADAVSLHVPLSPESEKLIGARELNLMKAGALLVNTARGGVVDTSALIAALDSGHLAGAALDVFDVEPLPAEHPILHCEQVVLSPHHADHTPEGIELLNAGAVDNVIAFLEGHPRNVVT